MQQPIRASAKSWAALKTRVAAALSVIIQPIHKPSFAPNELNKNQRADVGNVNCRKPKNKQHKMYMQAAPSTHKHKHTKKSPTPSTTK